MEHFIVDMQTEKSKKYYFIREEVSQEIVLLPSQYLMHKMRAKGSPNTIKRSALVISYYLNYLSENQLTMEDVWNMKYEKQQEHFTDFLIWLKAGMHSKDEYTKKPYNETCNAYLKEVFRLYNFAEQQEGCEQSLKVLSDAQYIVRNSVGIRKILNRRSFHGYLKETGHIGRTIEQDKIVILLKACANCRDQVLLLLLLLMPEAVEALKQMILVAWAGGESVMDLRCLLDGRKVPLVKSADKWVVSLSQLPLLLTDGGSVRGNDSGEGVGYSDYIRMFLFLKSVPEITMRTLDCVEEALHSKHILFQADQCVTKLEIQNKIIVYKNLNYQYPVYFGYE